MKIRKLTQETYPKASALLAQTFSHSKYQIHLFEKLHKNERIMHEWVCLQRETVIAYIGFSTAYDGANACGLHLTLLAVKPQLQNQGIGSELLRFSLRQDIIKERPIYVLGNPGYFKIFGFERCVTPVCPLVNGNANFLSIRNDTSHHYTVGYEPEFEETKKSFKYR